MIYTTGWTREKVRSLEDYQAWLRSQKDGDEVLFQQFHPPVSGCFGMPFERWRFERVRIWGGRLEARGDTYPVDMASGEGRYWDGKTEWGNVFPARLVPLHSDLPAREVGASVWGHEPVYEPLFFHNYRHHAIARYGKDFSRRLGHKYKRYYWRAVDGGEILTFFSPDEPEALELPANVHYMYSEYLKP